MELGVNINPVAFLVVQGENVKLLPVNYSSYVDKLLDYVPDIMEKIKNMTSKKEEKNENIEMKIEIPEVEIKKETPMSDI